VLNTSKLPPLIRKNDTNIITARLNKRGGDFSKRWYIDISINGITTREWVPSRPLESREDRAEARILEIVKGVGVDMTQYIPKPPKSQLEHFINLINNQPQKKYSDKTKGTYRTSIKVFFEYFKDKDYRSIKPDDAKRFETWLGKRYDSEKTIKNKINHIKAVFSLTKHNPLNGITATMPDDDSDFNYPYTEYEKTIIEDYLKEHNYRLYLFTRFMFYGFIRPKELINLRVQHIDLRNKTIRIPKEISKNKRSAVVPLVKPLYNLIVSEGFTRYPGHFYLFGEFLNTGQTKAGVNYASRKHKEALEALGIHRENETVLYSWKHTGNCLAYMAGMDIKLIQTINRHRSLETTEIYLRKLGIFLNKQAYEIEY
jgi:integrase